jgi:hypothetical protein
MKMNLNNEDNVHGLEDLDDTRETAPIIESKPTFRYQVKRCCDEMPHHMYVWKGNSRIDIEADHYFSFEDVKYCLYCGNRTMIEAVPERRNAELYKPDLSSLSAKDKALEELKEQMKE